MKQRAAAELLATAFLLAAVVGSGIMGSRLFGGNPGLTLLVNSLATGGALAALIAAFSGISGAHMNPAVTLSAALLGESTWRALPVYAAAQAAGALAGVAAAHAMFGLPVFSASQKARAGIPQLFSEVIATFGLVVIAFAAGRAGRMAAALAVAGYITAAYWFTSSTSFANPAVTLARSVTNTFVGIRPRDVPGFLLAQGLGAALGALFLRWLLPRDRASEQA